MTLARKAPGDRSLRAGGSGLTAEDFRGLPDEEPYRFELVRGEVIRRPAPGPVHCHPAIRLAVALEMEVRDRGDGVVLADMPYVLTRNPDSVRVPHLSFVRSRRLPDDGYARGPWTMAPDLAVETSSPLHVSSSKDDAVDEYLRAGSRMVWRLDPVARIVTVNHADGAQEVLGRDDQLDGGDVLPRFRLRLRQLFD